MPLPVLNVPVTFNQLCQIVLIWYCWGPPGLSLSSAQQAVHTEDRTRSEPHAAELLFELLSLNPEN